MRTIDSVLYPFALAALLGYGVTPLVIFLATKFGIIDDPAKNKHPKVIHTYPVPRAGGVAVFVALLVSALVFLPLDKHLTGILIGATLIAIVGLIDDKVNLNPYLRLVLQFAAASAPIIAGIGIAFATNPLGGVIDLSHPQISFTLWGDTKTIWVLADAFALLWIVALMNFINMGAKGIDGQLPGVAVIAALTIALLSLKFSADITQWPVILLALITAGAFFGFLPWNAYPMKILPGFGASNLAGYMLGVLSILSTAKVGTLVVVLGVPLIDTTYTIIRRVSTGKSPVWGDRGHLHHLLLDKGWSKKSVTYFYWITTGALGIIALNLNARLKLYTIGGVALFVGGLLLYLRHQNQKNGTRST